MEDLCVGRVLGRSGLRINQVCDIAACFTKYYDNLLLPTSAAVRHSAVEVPQSIDGVGKFAVVARRVFYLGRSSQDGLVRYPQSVVGVVQPRFVVKLFSLFARGSRVFSDFQY